MWFVPAVVADILRSSAEFTDALSIESPRGPSNRKVYREFEESGSFGKFKAAYSVCTEMETLIKRA